VGSKVCPNCGNPLFSGKWEKNPNHWHKKVECHYCHHSHVVTIYNPKKKRG